MKYNTAQLLFSDARMNKFLRACGGDKRKAVHLYRVNMLLAQHCFCLVSLFEVILRNAIDKHYRSHFGDPHWIVSQAAPGLILEHEATEVMRISHEYTRRGIYSNDKMTASFSFGFWTYLFTRRNFRLGGNSLLQILPYRRHGLQQVMVYNDLTTIRCFRNRIAHQEPICFDCNGQICADYVSQHCELIQQYMQYLGVPLSELSNFAESPNSYINKLRKMQINT